MSFVVFVNGAKPVIGLAIIFCIDPNPSILGVILHFRIKEIPASLIHPDIPC
jgi:hypothetical protein